MLKANLKVCSTFYTDSVYQWELNRVLTFSNVNLDTVPEVHFSNSFLDRAISRQAIKISDNEFKVNIPNSLLQYPGMIDAHVGIYDEDTFKVVGKIVIPVNSRKRPADYQIQDSDEEIYSFNKLENMINQIDEKWSAFTTATVDEAVDEWLTAHPETTTTVQDGSLTVGKFTNDLKLLTVKDCITPQMFGAKGDGVADDTIAIADAINSMTEYQCLYFPPGEYLCSGIIFDKDNCRIDFDGVLVQAFKDEATPLLEIKGKNICVNRANVKRECAKEGIALNDLVGIGIRVTNSKNISLFNPRSQNFGAGLEIYSDNADGCAYIDIYNPFIVALEGIKASRIGDQAWTNEVHVFGGRLSIHSTYTDYSGSSYCFLTGNAWRFYGVCMEGKKVYRKITGDYAFSSFIGCRFEEVNASGTDIDIFGSWNAFRDNYELGVVVNDTGEGNDFDTYASHKFGKSISVRHTVVTGEEVSFSWKYPIILADASNNRITLMSPNANNVASKGVEFTVKKIDASSNRVWIYFRPNNPDHGADVILTEAYESVVFFSDGEKWHIKSRYKPSDYMS